MAFIPSSTTTYAKAYLTELGRDYLFDSLNLPRYQTLPNGQSVDALQIESFSFHDDAVDYNEGVPILASGEMMDISGGQSESGIQGAKGKILFDFISPGASNLPGNINTLAYKTTQNTININLSQSLAVIPTVVTQQLMLFINGVLTDDGMFYVTPTNYGNLEVENGQLIIVLQQPTVTQNGYRLRIFYPTTGTNYNQMTFQFEIAAAQLATVTSQTTTTVTPTTTG